MSSDREHFDSVWFDTKEEAIEEAASYSSQVWVGRIKKYIPTPCGSSVLAQMAEDAYDEVGDASEGWLDMTKQDELEFEKRLFDLVKTFLKEKKLQPNFYGVTDIVEVK